MNLIAALKVVVASITTLYHGSSSEGPTFEVKDEGLFGGVFAHHEIGAASSHGIGDLYEVDLKESDILTQADMENRLDYDKIAALLKNEWPDANQELLYEAVVEEASMFTSEYDELAEKLPGDRGDASWEAQRLRGVIAKEFGYKAVEMDDEHGTSHLILPPTVMTRVEEEE